MESSPSSYSKSMFYLHNNMFFCNRRFYKETHERLMINPRGFYKEFHIRSQIITSQENSPQGLENKLLLLLLLF